LHCFLEYGGKLDGQACHFNPQSALDRCLSAKKTGRNAGFAAIPAFGLFIRGKHDYVAFTRFAPSIEEMDR
jgi:hypothetical protein